MKTIRFLGWLAMTAILIPPARSADTPGLEARRKQLTQLLDDEWEYEMREAPESATMVGDYRYNDRWNDNSLEHTVVQRDALQRWLVKPRHGRDNLTGRGIQHGNLLEA